jgi:uncharacterized protein (TIGR00268 family)
VVSVTLTKSTKLTAPVEGTSAAIQKDETKLVDSLLSYTAKLMENAYSSINIIAFSGGVDSSLAASLVYQTFHNPGFNDSRPHHDGSVLAVLGVSPSLPDRQLQLARNVALTIGIELQEVKTTEGSDETYIANKGQACFVCKNHLYSALEAVSKTAASAAASSQSVILYNGTNANDTQDPTRLGLISASNFKVKSPLIHITKEEVRRAARHLGLPNWDYAASPCLRSRLALGVEATAQHLQAVNLAEEKVKRLLQWKEQLNMRVRMLSGKRAMIELDHDFLSEKGMMQVQSILQEGGLEKYLFELGFTGGMGVRSFRSGAVSVKSS